MTHAFVRIVSRSLADCELLHAPRRELDVDLARRQHGAYVTALEQASVAVTVLPELADLPDATFVEDTVLVLDEVAVLGRFGVASRQPESERIEQEIIQVRPVSRISAPGTLEGGDVLRIGRTLYVGLSTRTNPEGVRQLQSIVSPLDYCVVAVNVNRCLHLKTGVTSPAEGLLVANPDWIDCGAFRGFEILPVPPAEPWGANTISVNGTTLIAANAFRTAGMLDAKGLRVTRLDISELQKAEAGLTCLSVLLGEHSRPVA